MNGFWDLTRDSRMYACTEPILRFHFVKKRKWNKNPIKPLTLYIQQTSRVIHNPSPWHDLPIWTKQKNTELEPILGRLLTRWASRAKSIWVHVCGGWLPVEPANWRRLQARLEATAGALLYGEALRSWDWIICDVKWNFYGRCLTWVLFMALLERCETQGVIL